MLANTIGIRKVLVCDPDEDTLLTLSHLFSNGDTTVYTSTTRQSAENLLSRHRFNLVIADLRMSGFYGKDGLALIGYIKQLSSTTEVIISTPYGSAELQEEAYRKGALYFCEKPLDIVRLFRHVTDFYTKLRVQSRNKRTSVRRYLNTKIAYSLVPRATDFAGVTLNISEGGLCMYSFMPIAPGQHITINNLLPDTHASGSVVWQKKMHRHIYKLGLLTHFSSDQLEAVTRKTRSGLT